MEPKSSAAPTKSGRLPWFFPPQKQAPQPEKKMELKTTSAAQKRNLKNCGESLVTNLSLWSVNILQNPNIVRQQPIAASKTRKA